jgi:hypothetical protein
MTLVDQSATTSEGAIAKLRVAFSRSDPIAWSDHAIMDPAAPTFRKDLKMEGLFDRRAWGAIEDLARVGGINLAEQGA